MPTTTEMTGRGHDCFAPSTYDQLESSYEEGTGTQRSSTENVHTIPSGLSALIRAATAQLSELIEEERARENNTGGRNTHQQHHDSNYTYSSGGTTSDDGASSDGGEHYPSASSKPNTTPLMVPENPPPDLGHKPQSFPEILMSLALDPCNEDTIAFLPDGKFFAMRSLKFTKELLLHNFEDFSCQTFEEFLLLLHDWGFSRILHQEDKQNSIDRRNSCIEVYRHPKFVKGDWKQCATIRFGESPTNARLSALPDRAILEYTTTTSPPDVQSSEDAAVAVSSQGLAKRRLSPTSYRETRRDSDFTTATTSSHHSHKKRLSWEGSTAAPTIGDEGSVANTTISRSDEIRSVALALTAEKLNLKSGGDVGIDTSATTAVAAAPLVDQAVKSATHTIVTDAIETLLNDENHTKATYQKHAQELSRSSLPGVIPISKQLFEPSSGQQGLRQVSTGQNESPPNQIYTSDTTAEEAASVIVEVAIAAQEQARQDELAAAGVAAKPEEKP